MTQSGLAGQDLNLTGQELTHWSGREACWSGLGTNGPGHVIHTSQFGFAGQNQDPKLTGEDLGLSV